MRNTTHNKIVIATLSIGAAIAGGYTLLKDAQRAHYAWESAAICLDTPSGPTIPECPAYLEELDPSLVREEQARRVAITRTLGSIGISAPESQRPMSPGAMARFDALHPGSVRSR